MVIHVPDSGLVSRALAARSQHDHASLGIAAVASLALHVGVLSAAAWMLPADSSSPLLVTRAGPAPDNSEPMVEVVVVASEESVASAAADAPALTDQPDDAWTGPSPADAPVETPTESRLDELRGVATESIGRLRTALAAWLDRIESEAPSIPAAGQDSPVSSPPTVDPAEADAPASNPGGDTPQASSVPGPEHAQPSLPASRPPAVSILAPAPIAGNVPPVYPTECRRRREQGTVTLRIHVGADGRAIRVAVDRSSGVPRLDEAALTAAGAWRFTPATENGVAVEADAVLPVRFVLSR